MEWPLAIHKPNKTLVPGDRSYLRVKYVTTLQQTGVTRGEHFSTTISPGIAGLPGIQSIPRVRIHPTMPPAPNS